MFFFLFKLRGDFCWANNVASPRKRIHRPQSLLLSQWHKKLCYFSQINKIVKQLKCFVSIFWQRCILPRWMTWTTVLLIEPHTIQTLRLQVFSFWPHRNQPEIFLCSLGYQRHGSWQRRHESRLLFGLVTAEMTFCFYIYLVHLQPCV